LIKFLIALATASTATNTNTLTNSEKINTKKGKREKSESKKDGKKGESVERVPTRIWAKEIAVRSANVMKHKSYGVK
jgi:hypothetical protein